MPQIGEKGEVKKKFLALDLCATYRREGGGKEEVPSPRLVCHNRREGGGKEEVPSPRLVCHR